jgi:hypothetical protein
MNLVEPVEQFGIESSLDDPFEQRHGSGRNQATPTRLGDGKGPDESHHRRLLGVVQPIDTVNDNGAGPIDIGRHGPRQGRAEIAVVTRVDYHHPVSAGQFGAYRDFNRGRQSELRRSADENGQRRPGGDGQVERTEPGETGGIELKESVVIDQIHCAPRIGFHT